MYNALNLSIIEGNLVRDPELFYTKNGSALCKIDVAVSASRKVDDKYVKEVSYISVNTWNKVAEASAKYLKKGSAIRARGRLKQSTWLDKNGKKNYKIFVDASNIDFLSSGGKNREKSAETETEKVPF
ncbi:MAG TPA: single-stranded DNA-binding protein [Spirochaetota bacterium]|jgi:single-strand DNA-binding protein|nr:MAG: Single-stranded DNA-binding protein [Spirochaetes bacterium ADurb.Bin133]HNZ27659.1 single-stranded DNA-binding protein [Spirochaetota bacterium]HPY88751.1 single-stranded DNA-binding protein [Spirochaetota bacterium]